MSPITTSNLILILLFYWNVISIYKFFIVKFVVTLVSSPCTKYYESIKIQHNYQFTIKWMKDAKANTNFITRNLQTNEIGIWLVSLKQYNKWMFWTTYFYWCHVSL